MVGKKAWGCYTIARLQMIANIAGLREFSINRTESVLPTGVSLGMTERSFKNIPIDFDKVEPCIRSLEIENLKVEVKSPTLKMFSGLYEGDRFALQLFKNNGGKCTLGKSTGYSPAAFAKVAEIVADQCSFGGGSGPLNLVIKISNADIGNLIQFLEAHGAEVAHHTVEGNMEKWRIRGQLGDTVALTAHKTTGTFQAQGVHAELASHLFDFVCNVLGHAEAVEKQRQIYQINLTHQQVADELVFRIPTLHGYLEQKTRMQFSNAHALSKVGIPLEDYSVLAFPALRGIEGFCFQILKQECKLKPEDGTKLGSYFEVSPGVGYRMLPAYRENQNPLVVQMLDGAYTLWHNHRHGLFHMDHDVAVSRVLKDREAAIAITDEVLKSLEGSFSNYMRSKT